MVKYFGPYQADKNRVLNYVGNRLSSGIKNLDKSTWPDLSGRGIDLGSDRRWACLRRVDAAVFAATSQFFMSLGAKWTNLPLTTLMISSPGEVYAGQTLDYTTDALPIEFTRWFDHERRVFLSESSQFYLELALAVAPEDGHVFSIYNSFRKEYGDITHLSEFQHIEYEGHVSGNDAIQLGIRLVEHIVDYVISNEEEAIRYFLKDDQFEALSAFKAKDVFEITFKDALEALYKDTRDDRYKEFSLKHFGSWEEIRLTELVGGSLIVKEFPLMQIPFYHATSRKSDDGIPLANNADLILAGFRETIGCGQRISNIDALSEKARIFNLPLDDYEPYFEIRRRHNYRPTAGFGLGWQRLLQWMLCLPYIWEASLFPRGHNVPTP